MVFQKPNPFPKSIYDNIAFGPRVLGMKDDLDGRVERALRRAALWDEVKDRLDANAYGMSGGQQQRLCIARCLAVDPDVILMDEPCSALDPISTGKIEDLMLELKQDYSIVIVTHNMQQAARISDRTAFLIVELDASEKHRTGPRRRVRRDREDLHQPVRPAHRGLRDREGGLMAPDEIRLHYQRGARAARGHAPSTASTSSSRRSIAPIEAVEHQDIELAELVIADDDVIDGRYLEIHQAILTLLATQAPVATDLRLIAALLHVMKNIERMGDQCVNIAKLIPIAGHEPPADEQMLRQPRDDGQVAARARSGRRSAPSRSATSTMARDLVRQDDVIDNLNRECFQRAIEIGDEHDRREWAMTMMLVARALERIGDNAVDVGEQVAFVVTGLFREFEDASHPGEETSCRQAPSLRR